MRPLYPASIRSLRKHDTPSDSALDPDESSLTELESAPFLTQEHAFSYPDLEDGTFADFTAASSDSFKGPTVTGQVAGIADSDHDTPSRPSSRWSWRNFIPFSISVGSGRRRVYKDLAGGRPSCHISRRTTPLRSVARLLAFALMLLGLLEFIALACGLFLSFFPDAADDEFDGWRKGTAHVPDDLTHWPTDFSADIHPVACHSHNDYWRKRPLFSALEAGCTGVEADVWLYDQELYVGHSTSSLTPERTFRSLYVDPLLKILDQQNPHTSFHPAPDTPRSGVFDTNPAQTLVLLIDFKTEGHELWPVVSGQLAPLRQREYLSHFNGTHVVHGAITVVVTGNAPWNDAVADPQYRDMFFDAPLDLMGSLSHDAAEVGNGVEDEQHDGNQGQGRSGEAPSHGAAYTPANSYFASVSFRSTIGFPWRGRLSRRQLDKIRRQIAGAHAQGLKVRYWDVPSWPRGLRNYMWRALVREGADYLNVDDLKAATRGDWNWGKKNSWFSGPWRFWLAGTPS